MGLVWGLCGACVGPCGATKRENEGRNMAAGRSSKSRFFPEIFEGGAAPFFKKKHVFSQGEKCGSFYVLELCVGLVQGLCGTCAGLVWGLCGACVVLVLGPVRTCLEPGVAPCVKLV